MDTTVAGRFVHRRFWLWAIFAALIANLAVLAALYLTEPDPSKKIRVGMADVEVEAILGKANRSGNYESTTSEPPPWMGVWILPEGDVTVNFDKDDKVVDVQFKSEVGSYLNILWDWVRQKKPRRRV